MQIKSGLQANATLSRGALSCSGREPVLSDFTSHFLERVLTFWR
jgi:hypothetical protein